MTQRDPLLPRRAWLAALLMLLSLAAAAPAAAQGRSLPAWDQLGAAQREQLIAPMRERWNSQPQARARMLQRAQRWQQMTPQQRERARNGLERLRKMTPQQRRQARAAYQYMRQLPDEERRALRERLREMTPQQRRDWLRQNAPP